MKHTQNTAILGRLFVVLIISIGIIAGCDSTPEPTPTPTPQPTVANTATPTEQKKEIVLIMGSWRRDDIVQMARILSKFHESHPNIIVKFDPIVSPESEGTEYEEVLLAQFEGGTGPDICYLRSYSTGQQFFDKGYIEDITTLPGLQNAFSQDMLAPWTTNEGKIYAVPFIATSHGIYYNADIFKQLNISIPTSWEQFLDVAHTIQKAGIVPFANATKDSWTIAEIVFMNLAPNFIKGIEGRKEYLMGARCFNDKRMVSAFQAMKDIAPFLPPNHKLLGYYDSLQLFLQGKAAMWLGGSWDIPYFEQEKPGFEWSIFAPPPPSGQPGYVNFHLDVGMGLNAASRHKKEAIEFLRWLTTSESGRIMSNELPGFFPTHKDVLELENKHAEAFLALNKGRGTDVRFSWEKLGEGSPDAYSLIRDGAIAVINGQKTPQQAADDLQKGLAEWFEPAQKCTL